MDNVALQPGVHAALDAILQDRLAILAGAGLSMAAPSYLPSAAAIAALAKKRYEATYGSTRPPLPTSVEGQAQFFFARGELATVFFRLLIDRHAFSKPHNPGHRAVADLLLVRAIQTAVTTNVDSLIEDAGRALFGCVGVGLDGTEAAQLHPSTSPLLKVHGCCVKDRDNMVWAPGQLGVPPVSTRVESSKDFLGVRLLARDLLIVGYSTDWDYLNAVIQKVFSAVRPARVIIVDTLASTDFARKAPGLIALGERASVAFLYVQASGADYLDTLRKEFSRVFLRKVLHSGQAAFAAQAGIPPSPAWLEPPDLDTDTLWLVRRDLEGRLPNEPAQEKDPHPEDLLGQTLLQLRAAGAQAEGPFWALNGRLVRVLRTANRPLHLVEADFERELAPIIAPDVVIAVGAEAQFLPHNIVRPESNGSIARGSKGLWLARSDAIKELGLQ